MRDHLPLAGRPHAIAFDGFGEDDGRLALVVDRRFVSRVNFDRIMPAPGQRPDLGVGPIFNHCRRLGMAAEEVLADIGAVLRLEVLVFAVDAFVHELTKFTLRVPGEQRVPTRTPQALDDVPASAAEISLQLLHDLPVAAHRPVETLQIAIDDEDKIVELLASGKGDCAERFRLVHLAVAAEDPNLARRRVGEASPVQIA